MRSLGYSDWLMVGMACFLEIVGFAFFLQRNGEEDAFWFYYVFHLATILPLFYITYKKFKEVFDGGWIQSFYFFGLIIVFVPFVSVWGVILGMIWPYTHPKPDKEKDAWNSLSMPDLPYRAVSINPSVPISFASLRQILEAASDTNKKLKAILLSRQLPRKERIRLLQKALVDTDDEVRLLAYSLLEDIEKEISERIITLQKELKRGGSDKACRETNFLIAQGFWDLAYLGIAQQDLKKHFLNEAKRYLLEVLQFEESGNAWFLLGRIELHRERYQDAERAFKKAMDLEVSDREVLPWLAEAVFYQGRYDEVNALLTQYRNLGQVVGALRPIVDFWTGDASVHHA